MSDTDIAQASPSLMGIEDAIWQSTELANPHASGMEFLHSMDGPKEALSATAEVSPSDCFGNCYDAARMRIHLNASFSSQVPTVDSK